MVETGLELFQNGLESLKEGKFQSAIDFFDQFIQKTSEINTVIAKNSFGLSEWEFINEISHCEKKLNSGKTPFNGLLALSLVFKIVGNNDRRFMFLKKALKIDSNNHRIWREYAETSFQLGDMRNALQYFQEAINFEPNDSFSLEGIGLCYYYLDEPIKAVQPLQKALTFDARNHVILNHLAFILSELGELDEAFKHIQNALELDKDNNIYLDTFACILFLQEKYEESLKTFEKILNNKPNEWEVSWDILTNLYNIMGLHAKAKQLEEKLLI
jgi:tetratricopeptide (TPR) repeat protein